MINRKAWGLSLLTMAFFAVDGRSEYREGIVYSHVGEHGLHMDAHVPEGHGPFPAAIIVHGGGWVAGERKHMVQPLFKPLTDAGFVWFSIDYRLANGKPAGATAQSGLENGIASALMLGTAVDDVRQAVAYVKEHASSYRVDVNRIALIGESAGAQLASMAALKPGPNGSVRAVVAFYGPSDLVALAKTSRHIPDSVRQAIKGTAWEDMLLAGLRDLSPVNWVRNDAPPFLLIHGTADTLVPFEQSKTMCDKIRAAGGACELYTVEGGGHGIRWWESAHLTAYKQRMVHWLEKELNDATIAFDARCELSALRGYRLENY